MIIRNFYDDRLAQASYLVGCAATGEAIVIDPMRDIRPYVDMAAKQGLTITAITETHIHADYISGSRELAAATGATMYLSDEGDDLWKYEFAATDNAVLMKDGHVIKVGNLTLKAMHTPGHTPEHMSFLLTDHPASEAPHSLFTGDFIFVGDVGRPDLLERAANFAGTMEKGARILFQSIQKLKNLPDSLLLWPAHGAGSACGKSLGGSPVTSLGYERISNWAFQIHNEDKFADEVLAGQPEPPFYFKEMKRLNKLGPKVLGSLPQPKQVHTSEAPLLDVRTADRIREGFVKNSIAVPSGKSLANWTGWMLDYSQPVTLIADSQEQATQAAIDMAMIGLDLADTWILASDLLAGSFVRVEDLACQTLQENDYVLDVRGINEWNTSHVQSAHHIPLGYLPQRLGELPKDKRIVVHCAAGGRSPIGVSVLLKAGFENVAEIPGGMTEISQRCPSLVASA